MSAVSEKFSFENADGRILAGRLELPLGRPRAFAVFAHCFTCSMGSSAATRISRALGQLGLAVLRFDFTGLGGSEGEFENTDFSSNVSDLVAAAQALRERHQAPALLIGHSLGGAAVLLARQHVPEVRAVATIGAPSEPEHLRHILRDDEETIRREGSAEVDVGGRHFRIRREFIEDLEQRSVLASLGELDAGLLLCHSPQDRIVGVDHARRLFEAARHPKSFLSLDGADHLLTDREHAEYVAQVIRAWCSRYLDPAPEVPLLPDRAVVRVSELGPGFEQEVQAGPHIWLADEPRAAGGGESGPNPYDLLLAALGTCTSMTLRMYARHKELPLEHVSVTLRHSRVHAEDNEDTEGRAKRLQRIERVLELTGDLTDSQRQRLVEIAARCPVHLTLEAEKEIVTRLA